MCRRHLGTYFTNGKVEYRRLQYLFQWEIPRTRSNIKEGRWWLGKVVYSTVFKEPHRTVSYCAKRSMVRARYYWNVPAEYACSDVTFLYRYLSMDLSLRIVATSSRTVTTGSEQLVGVDSTTIRKYQSGSSLGGSRLQKLQLLCAI